MRGAGKPAWLGPRERVARRSHLPGDESRAVRGELQRLSKVRIAWVTHGPKQGSAIRAHRSGPPSQPAGNCLGLVIAVESRTPALLLSMCLRGGSMSLKKVAPIVMALALVWPVVAKAQPRRGGPQGRDERIARVIKDCEQRTDDFLRAVERAWGRDRHEGDPLDRDAAAARAGAQPRPRRLEPRPRLPPGAGIRGIGRRRRTAREPPPAAPPARSASREGVGRDQGRAGPSRGGLRPAAHPLVAELAQPAGFTSRPPTDGR